MSRIGRAFRRLLGKPPAPEPLDPQLPSEPTGEADALDPRASWPQAPSAPSATTSDDQGPEELLAASSDLSSVAAEDRALAAFSTLVGGQREARAIALGRALLARVAGGSRLRFAVAEAQVARADDRGALDTLAPMLDRADVSLAALAMAARAHGRLGDEELSSILWQRVLARDVAYPGAKPRAARTPGSVSAGATLASGGELSQGRYLVRRELGRGGAGAVFEALDRELGRPVALKVYHERGAAARGRLRLEARTPAALEHPGVIRIFDLDEQLGAISMEWVRGLSLKVALRDEGVETSQVRAWLTSLVAGLRFVHAAGFVHRDLKPSNVLLRRDHLAVLTDFGLALPVGEAPKRAGEGTRGFASPEQLRAAPARPSADVHSFGALLNEALPRLPQGPAAELRRLAQSCQALDPDQRPSLEDVAQALAHVFYGP